MSQLDDIRRLAASAQEHQSDVQALMALYTEDTMSCTKAIHDERDGGPGELGSMPTVGAMTYVLAKQPSGWRVALAQTTPRGT